MSTENTPQTKPPLETVTSAPAAEAVNVSGILVSKLDHPVIFAYGGSKIKLSARGHTGLLNKGALSEPLPAGVIFVSRTA